MITRLLTLLRQLQLEGISKGYLPGIFPSKRFHHIFPYSREDENIYFSAFITFILQEHLSELKEPSDIFIAKTIINAVITQYPSFKNSSRETYNFFKTNPLDFFPNGYFMHHFKFFKLADDADDTVYVYLTQPDIQQHNQLKQLLAAYANCSKKEIKHTLKRYQKLQCYNVYFGEKMPIELDACVLSTILYWIEKNKLSQNQHDEDSYTFLIQSIQHHDYRKYPQIVAPCYPTFEQISYHLSRLMTISSHQKFINLKKQLIQDILEEINLPKLTPLKTLLLEISLLQLGIQRPKIQFKIDDLLSSADFFYTSIPMMIPNLTIRKNKLLKINNWFGLRTQCDAYVLALLLEYELKA